ncbi:FAD:protein FMN transferase [Paenibacillus sp. ACRRX]|uniref:FAD:protein FMN transferase n=1 Tax=Paenibacillus sp. ACRRX TaxID=2918206 RepID=UPI001EF55A84|nr:FAD:protein FMN transferase [Paenibacillus sp. ACRRX]MCG7408132.1 FAD:protein FMN transferase [Paenibacillus sp. ACRRX]
MRPHSTSRLIPLHRLGSVLIVALSMALLFSGCGSSADQTTEKGSTTAQQEAKTKSYFIFDTIVTVKIYDSRANDQDFEQINSLMKDIESEMSRTLETSELYKLNAQAGTGPVQVSKPLYQVIETSLDYAARTHGRFDPSIGPLVNMWNIGHDDARVPAKTEIDTGLKLLGYDKVKLDKSNMTVSLEKDMVLDLGGIGKGYAADVIADYVRDQGYKSAIIDLGGNIYAVGQKPGGMDWTIGVQDPNESRGNQIGRMKVADKTIVTSGVYERYFVKDGKHYHHILDSKTGYPVVNNLNSVTIVTDRSTDADALSTSAFSLGLQEGMAFIESKTEAEAIFITTDQKVYCSSGIKKYFELTNEAYQFAELK